jgi:2'-5' RNA ligase
MTAMEGVAQARWQADDQLHITVRYIGEVERPMAEDIALALGQIHAPALDVAIRGVGAFEKNGRIDTLWAGVTPHNALLALHRKVDSALVRIGLEPEHRVYVPHITLARMPRSAGSGAGVDRWRADQAMLSSDPFGLDMLILSESQLTRDGAVYEPVARWPLSA